MKPRRQLLPWAVTLCAVLIAHANAQPLEKHYDAARAALAKGDATRAKRELRLSLQDNPLRAEAHFLLASLLAREGDLDQAAVGYQETVKLEPNNTVARYNFGAVMLLRGEAVLAARQFEEALAIRPEHVPTYNIYALNPRDDLQRSLKTQAATLAAELGQLRSLLVAESGTSISKPLLVTVVCWLVAIFLSFSLHEPEGERRFRDLEQS